MIYEKGYLMDFLTKLHHAKGIICLIFLLWEFVAMLVKGLSPHAMPRWVVDFKYGFKSVHDVIRNF